MATKKVENYKFDTEYVKYVLKKNNVNIDEICTLRGIERNTFNTKVNDRIKLNIYDIWSILSVSGLKFEEIFKFEMTNNDLT